jgi:trehalose 6-phosphate phosphatase
MPMNATLAERPALAPPPPLAPRQDSLFLDFDGTIAAIRTRPEAVTVEPAMRAALVAAGAALSRRLAVVSGRAIDDIDRMVGLPWLALAGVHGLERRQASGEVWRASIGAPLAAARAELAALAARQPRLLIEDKGLGVAVHYREAPDLADVAEQAARAAADRHGLVLQPGKMVFEVRQGGADKGSALRDFMALPPFRGSRPVFVGDDHTDEAGFAAAAALGGYGVLVGEPRATAATHRLPDLAAVEAWLAAAGAPA